MYYSCLCLHALALSHSWSTLKLMILQIQFQHLVMHFVVSSGTLLIFHWWKMTGITDSCWGYWERDKCLVLSMNGGDFSHHDTSRIGGCV